METSPSAWVDINVAESSPPETHNPNTAAEQKHLRKSKDSTLEHITTSSVCLQWKIKRRHPDLTAPINTCGSTARNREGLLVQLSSGAATAKILIEEMAGVCVLGQN